LFLSVIKTAWVMKLGGNLRIFTNSNIVIVGAEGTKFFIGQRATKEAQHVP